MTEDFRFSGEIDLKNFTYLLDISNEALKLEIARRITNLGGKTSFNLINNTILVIDKNEKIKNAESEKTFKKFLKVKFLSGGSIQILKDDLISKGVLLRIIHLTDLLKLIEKFETSTLEFHIKKGLPKDVDPEGTISLIQPNRGQLNVKYHTFQKIRKNNDFVYDFPVYHPNAPDKFSIFTTKKELTDISAYLNSRGTIPEKENEQSQLQLLNADNNIPNPKYLPLVRKEHNYCHLCSSRFDDYLSHIKSESHLVKKNVNKHLFDSIDKKFTEIKEFWAIRKETQINSQKEVDKIKSNKRIFTPNQNPFTCLFSTKYQTEQTSVNLLKESTQQNCETKHRKKSDEELRIVSNKENINSQNLKQKKNNIMNDLTVEFENFETQSNVTYKYNLTKKYKEKGFNAIAANLRELSSLVGKSIAFNIK